MPTEKMQRFCRQREYGKNSDAENGFRLPAALNLSTACHDGVGLGAEMEKRRDLFLKDFLSEQSVGNRFFPFAYIYGKKRQNVTKKLFILQKVHKNTGSEKMPIII